MNILFTFGQSSPVYTAIWDVGYLSLADAANVGATCKDGRAWYRAATSEFFAATKLPVTLLWYFSPFDVVATMRLQAFMRTDMGPFFGSLADNLAARNVYRQIFAILCRTALPRRKNLIDAYTEVYNMCTTQPTPWRIELASAVQYLLRPFAFAILSQRPGIAWQPIRMAIVRRVCAYYFRTFSLAVPYDSFDSDVGALRLQFPPIWALEDMAIRLEIPFPRIVTDMLSDDSYRTARTTVIEWLRKERFLQ